MNRAELIDAMAAGSGLARNDAERVLDSLLGTVEATLRSGERLQISGFGTFEVKEVPAHRARNPRTQEPVEIPASRSVVFRPGKSLKDAME